MSKPIVVLIHGMGTHTAPKPNSNERGSFGKECIDTFNEALQMYPSLKSSKIEDKVDFIEIHYNHLFDNIRNEMAENGQKFEDLLKGAGATTPLGKIPGLLQSIINFEASMDKDEMIYTHWLDVILYKLYFGEFIRVHVAKKLGEIITKNGTRDIHILAHSLGTAVIHDTLSKMYSQTYADNDEIADLSTVTHKLASLWQIANVSRLTNTVLPISDPYKSVVRPGSAGVTSEMMNIHHQYDPFTWPKNFSRTNNGKWVAKNIFKSSYRDIETTVVTQLNTHSITQYLHDPSVHLYLFKSLGITIPPKAQRDKASLAYENFVIDGAKARLKAKFKKVSKGNMGTLTDYYTAATQMMDLLNKEGV